MLKAPIHRRSGKEPVEVLDQGVWRFSRHIRLSVKTPGADIWLVGGITYHTPQDPPGGTE